MHVMFTAIFGLLLALSGYTQNIVTPIFVYKDGDASMYGNSGTQKEITVDGQQHSFGWIIFQTSGLDFSRIESAKMSLYVKSLTIAGIVTIFPLTSTIDSPESNVPLSAIKFGPTPVANLTIDSVAVEKLVQVDITSSLKSVPFYGIALVPQNGLVATFSSREGWLPPTINLTYEIKDIAAQWITDPPSTSLSDGQTPNKIVIPVNDQIVFQTGEASITLSKDGTITLKGKEISINSLGRINLKASSTITLKGSKIIQN